MRLIGVLVAVIAAYVWFKRRRPDAQGPDVPSVPLHSVPTSPTASTEGAAPAAENVGGDVADTPGPLREDTGGLDASAGWDDLRGGPAAEGLDPLESPLRDARHA
ncbi:hypothetical protein [Aeromicrobium sp. CTD01-1L150]|uniref:hypothetical protein n=1 Tax=Aeromicrobium sp. CTD01-1L150 TaxID=3341830 RepID=UPI0035C08697